MDRTFSKKSAFLELFTYNLLDKWRSKLAHIKYCHISLNMSVNFILTILFLPESLWGLFHQERKKQYFTMGENSTIQDMTCVRVKKWMNEWARWVYLSVSGSVCQKQLIHIHHTLSYSCISHSLIYLQSIAYSVMFSPF